MQTSVRSAFVPFSVHFEGKVGAMYLDVHDPPLVTVGIGNLIDPIGEALALPWVDTIASKPVSKSDIANEWNTVKNLVDHAHGPTSFWQRRATIKLLDADIDVLVLAKLDLFERQLKTRPCFAAFDSWPADAQLGLLSMAWAMGSAFDFPHFQAACQARSFGAAAAECHMADSNNPGLVPRNRANFRLFLNAAQVEVEGMDRGTLYYPQAL